MKNTIIYITSFLIAFFAVTLGIIYLNERYKNIFELDFTLAEVQPDSSYRTDNISYLDLEFIKDYFDREIRKNLLDSIKANTLVKYDTVYQEILQDKSLIDSIQLLKRELAQLRTTIRAEVESQEVDVKAEIISEEWVKQTAKLIESMDPKNAAKVIKNYSDNEARELIYSMKKNKAAEILTHLDPNFVNRITKSNI